jgi:hypothetical protein
MAKTSLINCPFQGYKLLNTMIMPLRLTLHHPVHCVAVLVHLHLELYHIKH